MEKKELTRRTFVKRTSTGAVGIALTAGGISSLFAINQNSDKLALLGGNPVRSKGSSLGVNWPVIEKVLSSQIASAIGNSVWAFRQAAARSHRLNTVVSLRMFDIRFMG